MTEIDHWSAHSKIASQTDWNSTAVSGATLPALAPIGSYPSFFILIGSSNILKAFGKKVFFSLIHKDVFFMVLASASEMMSS